MTTSTMTQIDPNGERTDDEPRSFRELVLDGRKYRLVPIDADGAPPEAPRPEAPSPRDMLTSRELEIATLVATGRANKQIAAELQISEWTVSSHLRRIYAKLDVDTRAAMVSRCFDPRALGK